MNLGAQKIIHNSWPMSNARKTTLGKTNEYKYKYLGKCDKKHILGLVMLYSNLRL